MFAANGENKGSVATGDKGREYMNMTGGNSGLSTPCLVTGKITREGGYDA